MIGRFVVAAVLASSVSCGGLEDVEPVGAGAGGVAGEWRIEAPTNDSEVVAESCTGSRPGMGGTTGDQYDTFARTCTADAVEVTQSNGSFTMADSVVACTEPGSSVSTPGALTGGSGTLTGNRVDGSFVVTSVGGSERITFTGTRSGDAITLEEISRSDLASNLTTVSGSCDWSPALSYPVTITR